MNRPRWWIFAVLAGAVVVFVFWFSARSEVALTAPAKADASRASAPGNSPIAAGTAAIPPAGAGAPPANSVGARTAASPPPVVSGGAPTPPARLILDDSGMSRSFSLALDELVRRTPDGRDETVRVGPFGDAEALRQAWIEANRQGGGEVFPVIYEDGVARSVKTRRLVTAQIRVEQKPGEALPAAVAGAVEVSHPEYAPGFAVVRMRDSFAALDALARVRALPGVQRADVLLAKQQSRRALPNDPLISSQWHLKNTGQSGGVAGTDVDVEPVWNYGGTGYRGAGVVVGVVDDGLQTAHPDLAANVRTDIDHDWNDSTADDPNPVAGDENNHGTSCGGNVAAIGNNALGVSGSAPEAKVVGLRLIAAAEGDQEESEAMAWRNDVIAIKSNSWGPNDDGVTLEGPGALTKAALKTAAESGRGGRGTIFLWAGGNGLDAGDNSNYDGYANSIYTIAIGAISNKRTQSYYSESGANLVVTSPSSGDANRGELDITTIDRTGADGYNTASGTAGNYATDFGGTSSATPTAAGVVALILQRNPNLGWRDVQEILIKSALKVNPTDADWTTNSAGYHFNHKFGAGLIDANAAVTLAGTWTNLTAQTSTASPQTGLSVAIPNNNATGITRTFDMSSANIRAEQVTVRVNINHTARGNLAITLTSPSGVTSTLAEVHSDTGDNYADWTFMTVHDWGENARGTWTLKIADRSSTGNSTGGALTAAELTVFGTAGAAVNTPPSVQLTSPADESAFSINAPVTLTATASDLNAAGAAGVVARVDFLSGSTVVGSDSTAPYSFTWTPPGAGTYTLKAQAVDSEAATGSSATVTINVANLPPSIAAASLSPGPQAFGDQALATTVTASDPEGTPVTFTFRWQSSADGVNFADAAGVGSVAALPAAPGNAGKVWRCVVTPGDGVNTGAAFTTAGVMVLTRPVTNALIGANYAYTSDLVLRGTATSFTRGALINEFSQGSGTAEWVELLTLQAGSLRQWKFDDSTADTQVITFANSAVWDSIPAGTRIVIYNGASKAAQLPADDLDPADGKMVVGSTNATYFSGTWPALGNGGDALILKDATAAVVHQLGYGSNATATPNIGSVGSAMAAAFTGDTEAAAITAGGWRVNSATTVGSSTVAGVTPGEGNTTTNATFAANLRSGFFSQPAQFRLGATSQTPPGLAINAATGVLSGTLPATPGSFNVVVERFNGLNEVVSLAFTLNVAASMPTPTPTPPPSPSPSPTATPTATPGVSPTPTVAPAGPATVKVLKKVVAAGGRSITITGLAGGLGPVRVTATNRNATKSVTVAAEARYVLRLKLFPGKNLILVRSRAADGTKSKPIRVRVTTPL